MYKTNRIAASATCQNLDKFLDETYHALFPNFWAKLTHLFFFPFINNNQNNTEK